MTAILKRINEKKLKLDAFRPFPSVLMKNMNEWFRVELTYTSNAIEGNTLSRLETAVVIEKGITVEGKSLIEHQEAVNHAMAIEYIKLLSHKKRPGLEQKDILEIHKIILSKIDDSQAGRYRNVSVRIAGSKAVMPNPMKIPILMDGFEDWIKTENQDHPAKIAADAHFKLVSIHPFADGNGRTARLIMNLILLQEGFAPAIIRKEDRRKYIDSIEKAQLGQGKDKYYQVIYEAVERSLDIYLDTLSIKSSKKSVKKGKLLKIGELSQEIDETVHTIRFWTKEGLLDVSQYTKGGYQLYDFSMIERVKKIRRLQKEKRFTIKEIKKSFVTNDLKK